MGLKGNLAEVSLVEIFQTLSQNQQSGLLRIQAPEGPRLIEVVGGAISIVANASNRIPLGELLFARGLISDAQLQTALAKQRETSELLGKTFIRENMVTHEHIVEAVRFQVEEEINDLILLREGEFDFLENANLDAKMALADGIVRLQEDPNVLLAEAAQRAEDWKEIRLKIPSQAIVFQLEPTGIEFVNSGEGLSPEGMILLRLIQAHRSVESMVQKACLGRINTNSMLIELWDAGLLSPITSNVYAGVAWAHLDAGREEESARVARYALTLQCSAPDRKKLQSVLDEVDKKKRLSSGIIDSKTHRVRSEVIRRQPSLMVRRKPTMAPYVIGGLFFVLLCGIAGGYYYLNRTVDVGYAGEVTQVGYLIDRAEECMQQKEYKKALAEFDYDLKYDRAKKLRDNKLVVIKDRIMSSAGAFMKRFMRALDSEDEASMPAFEKEFALYDGVPFEGTLRDSMQETGEAIRAWRKQKQQQQFDDDLRLILDRPGCDIQIAALYEFLKKHPPETMAAKARGCIAVLVDQRRVAKLNFEMGKKYLALGALTYARQKFDLVLQNFPDSKEAKASETFIKEISEKRSVSTKTLGVINNLIFQESYDVARKKLIAFLLEHTDSQTGKAARLMLHRMEPGKGDMEAELLRKQAEELESAGNQLAAREKFLHIANAYGYTRVAAKLRSDVTLKSNPPGAEIWINGIKSEYVTPAKIQISMIEVTRVALRLNGFNDEELPLTGKEAPNLSVNLIRTPTQFPKLMPVVARLGMTVKDSHVALINESEVAFWLRSLRGGRPLSRPIFREESTASKKGAGKRLPSFHAPLFMLSGKHEELELLLPTNKPHLWRINPVDGKARSLVLGSAPLSRPVPIVFANISDRLFIGVATVAGFECIDLSDGQPRFAALKLGGKADDQMVSIAYDQNSNLIFVPRSNGKLYAIDAKTGEVSWEIKLPKDALGSPVLRPVTQQLAVATASGNIILWDIALRGQQQKTLDMKEACSRGLIPVANGLVLVSDSRKIGFLSSIATTPLWSEAFKEDIELGPIEVGRNHLAVTMGSDLVMMEASRSVVFWRTSLPSKPVAIAAEASQLFISTEDSFLWEFKAE